MEHHVALEIVGEASREKDLDAAAKVSFNRQLSVDSRLLEKMQGQCLREQTVSTKGLLSTKGRLSNTQFSITMFIFIYIFILSFKLKFRK